MASPSGSRSKFLIAVLVGAVIRVAALALPVTGDMPVFKVWTYNAATLGVPDVYGVGGPFPYRRLVEFGGVASKVDYPPLALYELGVAGAVYSWATDGRFPDSQALTAAIKMTAVLGDVGMFLLVLAAVRRLTGDTAAARTWALAVWLNPAVILIGSVLGYVDPLFALPAAGALVAATGWPAIAGALIAAAVLTKPQAIFIASAVAVGVWNVGERRDAWKRTAAACAGAILVAIATVGPIVARGAFWNLVAGVGSLARHRFLSGYAPNVWWLVDYLLHVTASMRGMSLWSAVTLPFEPEPFLPLARLDALRLIGVALTLAAAGWATWHTRRARDLWLLSALAAAGRPRFAPIFVAVSAVVTLNLNLTSGIGDLGYAIPRGVTPLDASVVLAIANRAAFAWHAAVLKRECAPRAGT